MVFGRRKLARQQREAWEMVQALSATHVEPSRVTAAKEREKPAGRMMPHRQPLVIEGQVRVCTVCGAYRDWVVVCVRAQVWLRCPAGHEGHEDRLDTAWYDRHSGPITHQHDSYEDGLRHLGH